LYSTKKKEALGHNFDSRLNASKGLQKVPDLFSVEESDAYMGTRVEVAPDHGDHVLGTSIISTYI
jgi:hypothetical protein